MESREKRRSPRVKADKTAAGRIKLTVPVAIRDVSLYGVRLELGTALRPGQLYDLKADLGGAALVAQVRITRCSAGGFSTDAGGSRVLQYNAGAEFAQLAPDQKFLIERWIEQVTRTPRTPSGTLRRAGVDS